MVDGPTTEREWIILYKAGINIIGHSCEQCKLLGGESCTSGLLVIVIFRSTRHACQPQNEVVLQRLALFGQD